MLRIPFLLVVCVALSLQAGHFEDYTKTSGLDFEHFNGRHGGFYLPEVAGGGAAFFDYDGDGDLDVYMVQSAGIAGVAAKDSKPAWTKGEPMDRLYRNDLTNGVAKLVDVTEQSGIRAAGYGMGVATGDIDNDGDIDLYVTNLKANQLWLNNGDGTFTDVTTKAGVGDPRWSTSAAMLDYDQDGFLDIFVTNYVTHDPPNEPKCYASDGSRDYCMPGAYPHTPDRLYRNKGDGAFTDVSSLLRGDDVLGPGLGVTVADLNGDGRIDIYVANDGAANRLWQNNGDGFTDEALLAGVALNGVGVAEAGMGVDAGDFDEDGDLDLFLTHLMDETNTLYVNQGGWFEDETTPRGLGNPSRRYTAFGVAWIDVDNDGWLDLVSLNGAVSLSRLPTGKPLWEVFGQPNQLFMNTNGRFKEMDEASFDVPLVSRAAAFGDIDNDGDTDLLFGNNGGPARLLKNTSKANWVGFELTDGTRDQLGAFLTIKAKDQRTRYRRSGTDGSYLAANDPRVRLGLGADKTPVDVEVRWPDGSKESFKGLAPNQYHRLERGKGVKP